MSYSLITGGAGFIGSNLAHRLLSRGEQVFILDNLSRKGVESNLQNLQAEFPDRLFFEQYDISKAPPVRFARQARQVFHFAAQVAVTTSLDDPLLDFETNVRGTLNLLEALRSLSDPPALVFTSTNKVYGSLEDIPMAVTRKRYRPAGEAAPTGVSEARPLELPHALRLFERRCGSIRAGLRAFIPDPRHGIPHELHLRSQAMRE